MVKDKFEAGDIVVIKDSHGFRRNITYERHCVEKVYKNGNFVLVGLKDQWRPHLSGGVLSANKTTNRGGTLHYLDIEMMNEIRAYKRNDNIEMKWSECTKALQKRQDFTPFEAEIKALYDKILTGGKK